MRNRLMVSQQWHRSILINIDLLVGGELVVGSIEVVLVLFYEGSEVDFESILFGWLLLLFDDDGLVFLDGDDVSL